MLKFQVVVEKEAVASYLREKGIGMDIQGLFVMQATENGKIVGMGAASMCPAYAVLEAVVCDDDTIAYGMWKAMLNSLDLGGIGYVLIKNESIYPLAKRLRFQETTEGTYRVSLDGYFTSGCGKSL